jgi:Mn-dependent DtxR family transcriptional regulator
LIKNFLIDVLGVSAQTAEIDAGKREHVLSEETLERMREKKSV